MCYTCRMISETPVAPRAPRWQLSSVFPSFKSGEYSSACDRLRSLLKSLDTLASAAPPPSDEDAVGSWFRAFVSLNDEYLSLAETIESYCYTSYSVDTESAEAAGALSRFEEIKSPYQGIVTKVYAVIACVEDALASLCRKDKGFAAYEKYIGELLFRQKKQMAPSEEDLAADLARFGADAWSRLQDQLTSTADCVWDAETGERKTLVELRTLAYSPDRGVREKAFALELETCRSVSLPIAAALNAIKGAGECLNRRRGWRGFPCAEKDGMVSGGVSLEKSVWRGRISGGTLHALVSAMEASVPDFARYLNVKAKILGVKQCAFYDLFAPVSMSHDDSETFTWDQARHVVSECFASFSQEMAEFAENAFESGWIDGEPRRGKIGGAYMTAFPAVQESRVMCNFDGTFNSVMTVAHELGHAYHFEIMKDLPAHEMELPMTLAETASIFAETLVFHRRLATASPAQKYRLIEMNLQDGCQIICDILSRFYFERDVFDRRSAGGLTADDFCRIMADAQRRAYGGALDEEALHPYMWLVKCHYYSADLAFYNFPYAFGQLFSFALFSRFKSEGKSFAGVYKNLLRDAGRKTAEEIASEAGFNITDPDFWRQGIRVFTEEIDQLESLFHNAGKAGKL